VYRVTIGSLVWGGVSQDEFDRLAAEVDLKAPIEIAFIDQFGREECVFLYPFRILYFRLSAI